MSVVLVINIMYGIFIMFLVKLSSSSTLAVGAPLLFQSTPKLWQSARTLFDQ